MKRIEAGFSMVELMIVVLIIAILAATAIPLYRQMTIKAIAAEGIVNMNYLVAEEAAFFQVKDVYGSFSDMGLIGPVASFGEWNRFAFGSGGGAGAPGGGPSHGGWVAHPGGSSGSGGSGGGSGGGSPPSTSSASPGDSNYFVYTITLDGAKMRCTFAANFSNGFDSVLLSAVADRGTLVAPLSVLIHAL